MIRIAWRGVVTESTDPVGVFGDKVGLGAPVGGVVALAAIPNQTTPIADGRGVNYYFAPIPRQPGLGLTAGRVRATAAGRLHVQLLAAQPGESHVGRVVCPARVAGRARITGVGVVKIAWLMQLDLSLPTGTETAPTSIAAAIRIAARHGSLVGYGYDADTGGAVGKVAEVLFTVVPVEIRQPARPARADKFSSEETTLYPPRR